MSSLWCQLSWSAMTMTVSCAPCHNYEEVPGLLAPCAEVALAVLCGSTWDLSGRVKRALSSAMASTQSLEACMISILKQHNCHRELGCHICPFPSPQYTFPSDLCHLPSSNTTSNILEGAPLNHQPRWLCSFPWAHLWPTLCQGGHFLAALFTCLNVGVWCHLGRLGVPKTSAQKWQIWHRTTGNLRPSAPVARSQAGHKKATKARDSST